MIPDQSTLLLIIPKNGVPDCAMCCCTVQSKPGNYIGPRMDFCFVLFETILIESGHVVFGHEI